MYIILSVMKELCTLYLIGQLLVRLAVVRGNSEIVMKLITYNHKIIKAKLAARSGRFES